jgi:5,10-methylenetetrahydromethanopterin reductase
MASPTYSCALPPSFQVVEYARAARSYGYDRIWLFDSPALYVDVWVALARIAERVDDIGLGTAVLIPSLRHPMVTASAIAGIEEIAPGRLIAGFGTGYTGRLTMGRKPMRWEDLAEYIRQLGGLLRGDVVTIEGRPCQMIHSPGFAPPRPIGVPLWVAPSGPKGWAVARDLGVPGVITTDPGGSQDVGGEWSGLGQLVFGTVLRPGEDHTSPRVQAALGPVYTTGFHGAWERFPDALASRPGGASWRAAIEAARPADERHLVVHEGHLNYVKELDQPLVDAADASLLEAGWTGEAKVVAERFAAAAAAGVTDVLYNPAGPDIVGELRAFAEAVRL